MAKLLGFVGYSDSGKTTIASQLVQWLKVQGFRVAVIKHDAHGHYKEAAGKDSVLYTEAGADTVMVVSPDAIRTMEQKRGTDLWEAAARWAHYDFIIAEGFKQENHRKLAVLRSKEQLPSLFKELGTNVIGIVSDLPLTEMEELQGRKLPVFRSTELVALGRFIVDC